MLKATLVCLICCTHLNHHRQQVSNTEWSNYVPDERIDGHGGKDLEKRSVSRQEWENSSISRISNNFRQDTLNSVE